MRTKLRGKISLLFMTCAVLLAIPAVALADQLGNNLDGDALDGTFEEMALTTGGQTQDTLIYVVPINNDAGSGTGSGGCNFDQVGDKATVTVASNNTSVATAKWKDNGLATIDFTGCGTANGKTLTVTSGSAASETSATDSINPANITFTTVNAFGSGNLQTNFAQFRVRTSVPTNTPPSVSVTGVQAGATYEKGTTVPAAGCSVTDAEDANESATPVVDSSGLDSNGLGPVQVTCSYTDGGGLTETASATYNIVDTTAPVIAAHDDVTAEATDANGAVVNYTSPGTTDAVYGNGTANCTPASGSQFALGSTEVTCNATDGSGNAAVATTFNVIVKDTTAPTLTVPNAPVVVEATGPTGAVATYEVTAKDAVTSSPDISCVPPTGAVFGLGTTQVSCTAEDAAGNKTTKTFDVIVEDTTEPTLKLPANITEEATGPNGNVVNYSTSASDLVDGSVNVTCSPASGDTFGIKTTTVNCSATDKAGNEATGSFTVTVQDTTAPAIAAHADVNATATGANGALVSYTSPGTTDAVAGNGTANCTPASGSQFAVGSTKVTCTATDGTNTSTSSFNVIVAYSWSNFHQPINVTGTQSVFKLGSTVPVKFNLTGASSGITDGTFYLKYAFLGPGDGLGEQEAVATTTGTTGTEFRYSAGQYIYNWSTKSVSKPGNYELRVYSDSAGTVLLGKVAIEIKK